MARPPKKPRRQQPRVILFDEAKRAEYLTGFHKRKVERRKHALKQAADELKAEKRLLRERYAALVMERATMLAPDLQLVEAGEPINADLPDHTVTITELDLRPAAPTAAVSATAKDLPPISKKSYNKNLKNDMKMKPNNRKFQRKNKRKPIGKKKSK